MTTTSVDKRFPLKDNIFMLIGAASMCWTHIDGERVFDAERAIELGESFYKYLQEKEQKSEATSN